MKENNRKIAMDSMQALFSKFGIANILAAIRDASILLGRHIANAMIFSTVFDRFRAPRSIEASASVDSGRKSTCAFLWIVGMWIDELTPEGWASARARSQQMLTPSDQRWGKIELLSLGGFLS